MTKEKARQHFDYIDKAYKASYEPYLGEIKNVYYGNAADSLIREKAASGGAVTALVQSYLDKYCESEALLYNETNYRIYKKGDILPQGSIYHARSYDIPDSCSGKLLIVCLPCQVDYFRKIMPDAVIIGLFCSHRVDVKGVSAITREDDVMYRYKYNGNTGLKFGDYFIPSKSYWGRYLNYVHIPQECLKCHDATAEKADISVGDAHKHEEFYQGKNVIITRTAEGEALLNNAVESGLLEVEETNPAQIINTHPYIRVKKNSKEFKILIYKILRRIGFYITKEKIFRGLLNLWAGYIRKGARKIEHFNKKSSLL